MHEKRFHHAFLIFTGYRLTLTMNTVQQTAQAFITVYRALPEEVREEVKRVILMTDENPDSQGGNAGQRKKLTDRLRANPVSLPADFKFNREEANER